MADLSITVTGVHPYSTATVSRVQAGEALTEGQVVYLKADGTYWKCDANEEAKAVAAGIVISPAPAADDYCVIQTAGDIDLGATLTVGEIYCVSDTAGGIMPCGDLSTGEYVTIVGIATAANKLAIDFVVGAIAHA
jgi:hypothetical protein